MAELKASELKYGQSLKTSVGGLFLTATQIETPESAEYAPEGALYLNLAKLGLTVEAVAGATSVSGEGSVGEVATTTPLPVFAWSTPLATAKTSGEGAKQVAVVFPTMVTKIEGKLALRIFSQETAAIGKPMLEPKTATKAAISLCACTVFVLGK